MIPGILFAAVSSGCGKTTITCGAMRAWQRKGVRLQAWKCGPDYIDPMFHKQVLGVEGGNLDSFFLKSEQLLWQLEQKEQEADLAVIEGVMGFYDGLGGTSTQASTYEIAELTDTPVVLILDGKGSSLSIAAVLRGFLQYRKRNHIVGVLLNRTSKGMCERLRPVLEAEGVKVFGCLPVCKDIQFTSRHLGLVMPEEIPSVQAQLDRIADLLEESADLDGMLQTAMEYQRKRDIPQISFAFPTIDDSKLPQKKVRIAVARDEAFCFYYQENMALLEKLGAELVPFSPLHDLELPGKIGGVILGGGYPENYAECLSQNESMRRCIKRFWEQEMPFLAECGGFLYLHRELEDKSGTFYPMAGVLDAKAWKTSRLGRFGYISMVPKQDDLCLKEEIRGHEFHYWESENCGKEWLAKKPLSERAWDCVHSQKGQIAGFPHLYYLSAPNFAVRWLNLCRQWIERTS